MHPDWKTESLRLEKTLAFISARLKNKLAEKEYLIHQQKDINKDMWEEVRAMKDLESISDFMQYIGLLKQNISWSKQTMKDIIRLDRQLSSPYFGRIDFSQAGSNPQTIYIGINSLTDEDTMEILVHDWRAPVCSMFYDSETGPASYLCPAGRISGELTLKRQYKIEGGRLVYFFDSSLAIGDEMLREMLASNAGTKLRNIVSTIQKEQNAAIRNETSRLLAIQGAAGSGKTSVAMHRAAYLLYRHKKHIESENLVIISSALSLYRRLFENDDAWNACTAGSDFPGKDVLSEARRYTLENIESGLLGFEDAGPVLYLSLMLGETAPDTTIRHLIVDEAQDYSPVQIKGMAHLFPSAGITILGDINQNISPYASESSLEDIARLISSDDYEFMQLNKSYRSTMEINRFASGFLKKPEGEYFGRHGEKPRLVLCGDYQGLCHALAEAMAALSERKYKTAAVITRTLADARLLYKALQKQAKNISMPFRLMDEDFEYALEGIMVMPAYLAKGLEFDAAMIVISDERDYSYPEELGLFYTAVTRPLHDLSIFCPCPDLPPVLRRADSRHYTITRI